VIYFSSHYFHTHHSPDTCFVMYWINLLGRHVIGNLESLNVLPPYLGCNLLDG
jgi:hypothetical protein